MDRLIFVSACGATSPSLIVEMVRTTEAVWKRSRLMPRRASLS